MIKVGHPAFPNQKIKYRIFLYILFNAKFIKCSCENTRYRRYDIVNHPINIELVTRVRKIQECYYPDNVGRPAIQFDGIDNRWVYGLDQIKERDSDYNKIINNEW